MAIELEEIYDDAINRNYAEEIIQEDLDTLGSKIVEQVDEDLASRSEWDEQNDMWMGLAAQFLETKTWPWPNAASVKYPLLGTASLQFHARSYPALVNEQNLVKIRKHGKSSQEKIDRSERIRNHMSYQILEEMTEWQEDMDRLLYVLPITGLIYKKVYYSPSLGRITAPIILARDVIINYEATNFERATKTHRIYMDANEVREMQNMGVYLDAPLDQPNQFRQHETTDEATGMTPPANQTEDVHTLYECHGWWDFDNDGYKEPYIVTVDKDSRKVLSIVARFEDDNVQVDDDGDIVKITPTEYFIPYKFLPNPESSIYALGFGALIGPLNEAVNTIINQLLDAGTLNNLQGGFLSKQMRIRGGALRFKPGEWKQIASSGTDIKNGIYPLPTKDPSNVLFLLLGRLIESGERLSSVQDLMTGENPGQNQPYSTTMAVLEQGLKVFTGIYKRVHRSLGKEFKRIFSLNGEYLDDEQYFNLLDIENGSINLGEEKTIGKLDYNLNDLDVIPGADPTITSEAHKILRAQSLEQKVAAGMPLNITEVTRRSLEAENHEDIETLMTVEERPPPPDVMLEMEQFEHQKKLDIATLRLEAENKKYEALKDLAQAVSHLAKAKATGEASERDEAQLTMDTLIKAHEGMLSEMDSVTKLIDSWAKVQDTQKEETTGET